MIKLSATFLLLISLSFTAQAQDSGIEFNTPPEWRGETIKLPPGFAPDLKWNGVEHIRFAPGMFKPDSESFFSYVLVFLLNEGEDVSEESVKQQVLTYYKGLSKAVMGGKQKTVDTSPFSFEMEKAKDATTAIPAGAEDADLKVWNGTLKWVEPFATEKDQTLAIEVHLWMNDKKPVIYFTVSPQEKDHAIWEEMRKYRAAFETK